MRDILSKLLKYKPIIFLDHLAYRIGEDGVFAIGAQLSYFLMLSIFPFLIVLLNIISYTAFVDIDAIYDMIQYLPPEIQNIITGFIRDIVNSSSQKLLSIAAIAGIWTASSGVTPVIRAINKAYDYEEKRSFLRLKALSLLFTIALLVLFIIVIVALVFGELLGRKLFEFLGRGEAFLNIWSYIRILIPMLFMIYTFALLYKYSPCVINRREQRLLRELPGGIFATLGWLFTSTLFSYYVSNFGKYSTTYGSIGGVIILLIWLYLSSIIIVLGGEINATIAYFSTNSIGVVEKKSILSRLIK